MDPVTYKTWRKMLDMPHGIMLVTGPTGSGKTTTLYSSLIEINAPDTKIITTEDPVEYELPGAIQIPVNVKAGVTYEEGLKSVMRQDPDVILVGEADARELLQVPVGQATDIAVRLNPPEEAVVMVRKIAERLPQARILDRELMNRAYDLTFDQRGGILGAMLLPALTALLVLAWDRFTGVGPNERQEIGALKAMGWLTADVLTVRLLENLVLGLEGAVAGMAAAYLYVFYAQAPGLLGIMCGWSSLYPAFHPAPAVTGGQVLVLSGLIVLPLVAAGLVPAWRAATQDPLALLWGVS